MKSVRAGRTGESGLPQTWWSACSPEGTTEATYQSPSFSGQFWEDEYAASMFFPTKHQGTFLELGALDGEKSSNTRFFELFRGWRGILIEANPTQFSHMCSVRKCSHRVSAAICDPNRVDSSTLHFLRKPSCVSCAGIWEFMSPAYRKEWYNLGLKDPSLHITPIQCHPLQAILDFFNVTHLDFFSLDVEGAELSVLQTLNFSKTEIDVMVVELDGHDPEKNEEARKLLKQNHFLIHGVASVNTWFVRENSVYASSNETYSELVKQKSYEFEMLARRVAAARRRRRR